MASATAPPDLLRRTYSNVQALRALAALRVGDASYSLYLWHGLLLVLLVAASAGLVDVVPRQLLFFTWLAVIVLAAMASYRWLERPMIRTLNRLFRVDGKRQAVSRQSPENAVASA